MSTNNRIKVVNETNHGHAVRLLKPDGGYTHKRLAKKGAFVLITEEQFLDLYTTTRDVKCGYVSFDESKLSDDIKIALGLPLDGDEVEAEDKIENYTEKELEDIINGHTNKLKKFIADQEGKEDKYVAELKRRVFSIAEKNEDMTRAKSEAIEEFTGKSFKVNSQNDEENKKK